MNTSMFITDVDVDRVVQNPNNKNKHSREDLERFEASVRAHGLINPVTLMPIGGRNFMLIAGECRWIVVKKIGWKTIPARIIEVDSVTADSLRLAENMARKWDILAECQEFANLHRQGKMSIAKLARDFGVSEATVNHRVAIGYFPHNLLDKIYKQFNTAGIGGKKYALTYIDLVMLLPLRIPKRSIFSGRQAGATPVLLEDVYDYTEVEKVVMLVESRELTSSGELCSYVAERKLTLTEKQTEQLLNERLEEKLTEARSQVDARLQVEREAAKAEASKQIQKLQQQLEEAVQQTRQLREERARLVAQQQTELQSIQDQIAKGTKETAKELEKRIAGVQEQLKRELGERDHQIATKDKEIARLTQQREQAKGVDEAQARKLAEQIIRETKKQLQQEYDKKLQAIEENYRRREERLRLKVEKELEDAVNHCKDAGNAFEASLRLLDQLFEQLDQRQKFEAALTMATVGQRLEDIFPRFQDVLRQARSRSGQKDVPVAALALTE